VFKSRSFGERLFFVRVTGEVFGEAKTLCDVTKTDSMTVSACHIIFLFAKVCQILPTKFHHASFFVNSLYFQALDLILARIPYKNHRYMLYYLTFD